MPAQPTEAITPREDDHGEGTSEQGEQQQAEVDRQGEGQEEAGQEGRQILTRGARRGDRVEDIVSARGTAGSP